MDLSRNYQQRRTEIYSPLREEGIFTWDVDPNDHDEYALATIHTVPESFRLELAQATDWLGRIYTKIIEVIQKGPSQLLKELGIPKEAAKAVRLPFSSAMPTLIGRFDFARTPQGLKMLEFNSDTPTTIVEAFYVNDKVCSYFGVPNPNQDMEIQITHAFQEMIHHYQKLGFKTDQIVFSSLDWHTEDSGTTKYLMHQSGLKAQFAPLSRLAVKQDRLYFHDASQDHFIPIDVLYRLHAIELLAKDQDEDGYPTGSHILHLIANQRVAIINPPSAFIAQTKALQALIWNLHEQRLFFTEEEHEVIQTYMLPTYLENPFTGKKAYVRKPIFGREGGAVTLYDQTGDLIATDRAEQYWDQMMVYQELAELEAIEIETLRGRYQGHLLWGSFLIAGKPSAIVSRVDQKITGNLSYFLPTGLAN